MKENWIWLAGRKGIGPVRARKLLDKFPGAEGLFLASPADYRKAGCTDAQVQALDDKDLTEAKAILARCEQLGIRVLTLADDDYPAALRQIPDAPVVLYCKGRLPELEQLLSIGIVGSRKASPAGLDSAMTFAYQLGRSGAVTVTGLARGIDTAAARGALRSGGPVIGVLGCGIDQIYPRENEALYAQVAEQGCLLSEYSPGTPALSPHFPARNRIISGLCDGILVVEASIQSGALITARTALDYDRDVFALPGSLHNPNCAGCNLLLRQGAGLVMDGAEIATEYLWRYPDTLEPCADPLPEEPTAPQPEAAPEPTPPPEPPAPPEEDLEQAVDPEPEPPAPVDLSGLAGELTDTQMLLLELLARECGPLPLELLTDRSGLPPARTMTELTMLQIKHYIRALPGRRYALDEGIQ